MHFTVLSYTPCTVVLRPQNRDPVMVMAMVFSLVCFYFISMYELSNYRTHLIKQHGKHEQRTIFVLTQPPSQPKSQVIFTEGADILRAGPRPALGRSGFNYCKYLYCTSVQYGCIWPMYTVAVLMDVNVCVQYFESSNLKIKQKQTKEKKRLSPSPSQGRDSDVSGLYESTLKWLHTRVRTHAAPVRLCT